MTPLEIEIILHYHRRVDDYRDGDFSEPAVDETITRFLHLDVLEPKKTAPRPGKTDRQFDLTERGQAYVSALTALRLPEKHWVIPEQPSGEAA